MLVLCCSHPTAEPNGKDSLFFTEDELPVLAKELVNCPSYIEHDKSARIGYIKDAFVSQNSLMTAIQIDDSPHGRLAKQLIRDGITKECSLGHECFVQHSMGGKSRVVKKQGVEVSICVQGARENTKIICFWEKEGVNSSGGPEQLFCKALGRVKELQKTVEQQESLIRKQVNHDVNTTIQLLRLHKVQK